MAALCNLKLSEENTQWTELLTILTIKQMENKNIIRNVFSVKMKG